MEEALLALLLATSAVTDEFETRINWVLAPQEDKGDPYCILQRISGERDYHTKGDSGLVSSRIQIDVYGSTYAIAKTGARVIVSAISGYRGTVSGINFQGIFIDSERDGFDEDNNANNRLIRVSVDALIWHTEN